MTATLHNHGDHPLNSRLLKKLIVFLCSGVIIFVCNPSMAQVSSGYIWSQSLQTYKSDTSTTTTLPATTFVTAWDDQTYSAYKFPFNFTYNNVLYTGGTSSIGIDADGWIAFNTGTTITMSGNVAGGSWVSPTDHTGVYLWGTGNNNGICGFNSDLQDQTWTTFTGNITSGSNVITNVTDFSNLRVGTKLTGTGITTGTVITKLNAPASSFTISASATITGTAVTITPSASIFAFIRGVAPYRQFVVQWTRATRYGTAGDDFSFQIVLNEGGSNPAYQTLQAVYGICKATNLTAQNSQVGLRGAAPSDYNARKTTSNWSATTAATANTDLCTLTPSVFPASGLTFTWSPACPASPAAAGTLTGPTPVCPGSSFDYSIPGVPGAIFYTWTYTGTNTSYSGTTTLPLNTLDFDVSATGGTLTVTPGNLCGSGSSSSLAIAVSGAPTASITYSSSSYCKSGSPVTPVISGTTGGNFTASPAGLTINASSGQITPSSSTAGSYLVTYTFTSGCTATTTANITINTGPAVTASATPALVCTPPNNSQLLASVPVSGYSLTSIPFASLTPSAGSTVLWNTYQLDNISGSITMPFAFSFYGVPVTNFFVATEGYIQLTTGTAVEWTPQTLPNTTVPNNIIALAWADLIVDPSSNPGSSVRYFVNGAAGNRILVIDYINLRFLAGSGQNVTGQIRLYESDSHIELAAGTVFDNGDAWSKTMGIENSTGTLATTPPGRNNTVWNTTNEAWSFIPTTNSYNYSWSPATYLNNPAIANPVATNLASTTNYIVTVTNTVTGCSSTAPATVTVGAPLSGTYTVGVGGNYTTLTAAVNAYNTLCIGGPVVFSLIDANYPSETFPININSNIYQSATNTLTIKPAASVNANISASLANNALFRVTGKYIAINGSNNGTSTRNLTITNTNTTSPLVVLFGSAGTAAVTNCALKNCIVTNGINSSSGVVISDAGTPGTAGYFSNDTIQNNLIQKAYTGVYSIAVNSTGNGSGLYISYNDLTASGANALYIAGIYAQDIDGATITGNQVANLVGTDSYDDKGIWLATGVRNSSVLNNRVYNLNYTGGLGYGAYGIYISTGVTNANILVANNMIANITGDGFSYTNATYTLDNPVGILLNTTQTGIKLYYNSISLTGNTLNRNNAISACIRLYTGSVADIRNNILSNSLGLVSTTGYGAIGILASTSNTQFSALDYNDYSINPTGSALKYIGQINTTGQTTLPNWRTATGKDAVSINIIPVFTSTTDLHLTPPASNLSLNNTGTPITGITNDYDTTTRNGLTPDIGADEFLAPNTGSWVGKTSIDWLTNTNWETNKIPDQSIDVTINGGYAFMPTVVTTQAVRGLLLSAPVPANTPILTLNAGTLQVYGTIVRSGGSISGANGTLEMDSSISAQPIPAGLFTSNNLKNLIINNSSAGGVSIGGALDIYRSVNFGAAGIKLNTGNALTFKSTASETAWLGNVTGKTVSGTATVERYIPTATGGFPNHGKSWQLLAIPVKGSQTVKQAWQDSASSANQSRYSGFGTQLTSDLAGAVSPLGFDVYTPTGGPSIKTYDPATNTYIGLANTSLAIQNKKGYLVFVRGDRTVTAYNQSAVVTVLRSKGNLFTTGVDAPPVTTLLAGKFESLGNPYASAINFLSITKPAAPAVDDVFYVWDPLLYGAYGYGAYQTISVSNGYKPNPGGTANYSSSTPYTTIQSGQAFFMHATGVGGNVSFTETAKQNGSLVLFRGGQNISYSVVDRQFLRAGLYAMVNNTPSLADGSIVALDPAFSNDYTADDALKLGNSGENFGILNNDKLLSIDARKPFTERDTVFYTVNNLRRQSYQFRFGPENMSGCTLTAWLVDKYLNSRAPISLLDSTIIDFTVDNEPASAATDRFMIVFKEALVVPVTITTISATRNSEKQIDIDWKVENEVNIEKYEVERSANGRNFIRINSTLPMVNNGGRPGYRHIDTNPLQTDNFYRIKSVDKGGRIQYSNIVKVGPLVEAPSISVYPNPVVDNTIGISFINQPNGEYKLRLTNKAGQVVYSNTITVNSSNMLRSLSLGKSFAAGSYQLTIIAEDGTTKVEQLIVR